MVSVDIDNPLIVNILLSGKLEIGQMEQMKSTLLDLLGKHEVFHIKVIDPEHVDLTFIQLLIAFSKSCRAKGKILDLEMQLEEDIQHLLTQAGITIQSILA